MSEPWTKGPWRQGHGRDISEGTAEVYAGDAKIAAANTHPKTGDWYANARLIAAAPDLYNALADVLSAWEGKSGMGTVFEMERALPSVRAALAKARGETP